MYDVEKLEKDWQLYRAKRRIPWIITGTLLPLVVLSVVFREELISIVSAIDNNETVLDNSSLKPYVPTMLPGSEQNQTEEDDSAVSAKSSDNERRKNYLKIELTDESLVYDESGEDGDIAALRSVEKNFEQFKRTSDSLYLAREYYKDGDYENAQKWALATNEIDSEIEESWFIFAKSKVSVGRKQEAMEVLSAYISKTNSAKARVLLQKIKKGKF